MAAMPDAPDVVDIHTQNSAAVPSTMSPLDTHFSLFSRILRGQHLLRAEILATVPRNLRN